MKEDPEPVASGTASREGKSRMRPLREAMEEAGNLENWAELKEVRRTWGGAG